MDTKRYMVITPYSDKKITGKCSEMSRKILCQLTKKGHNFNLKDLIEENTKKIKHTCSDSSFRRYHNEAVLIGVSSKILSKNTNFSRVSHLLQLKSIRYWQNQLRSSKYKHIKSKKPKKTTKDEYLYLLTKFDEWLVGKPFKIKKLVPISENTFQNVERKTIFSNVEELLDLLDKSPSSQKDIKKIIREYLNDSMHSNASSSYMNVKFSAIMSYFSRNDQPLGMKYDSNQKYDDQEVREESELTLDEFMSMLTVGRPSVMEKAIMMCKFHGGYDSSTLADRFNFDGFKQIVKHFKNTDHNSWDLEKCPVPITQIRIKTGYQYTSLLERDAIICIQKYLDYKIKRWEIQNVDEPLFLNHNGNPISDRWISNRFFILAERAGVQKKISEKQYKMGAHELRDLLKSTLIDSGCRIDVADHVIGHKPKDSYEKQGKLYPETLRKEYAKASKRLNIFTKFTSVVNGTDDSDELKLQLKEKISEANNILEKRLDDEAEKIRQEKFAIQQQRQMRQLQDTVDELKKEIRGVRKEEKPLEFCCINCEMIHEKESCPACGFKQRRIYEDKVQR